VSSPAGAGIFVRSGGAGAPVVLVHGYAETSDSWTPLAAELAKSYTVVVPDLRGITSPAPDRSSTRYVDPASDPRPATSNAEHVLFSAPSGWGKRRIGGTFPHRVNSLNPASD
jgi:pimeloyl-ACP methyl ester carboxylesterase